METDSTGALDECNCRDKAGQSKNGYIFTEPDVKIRL